MPKKIFSYQEIKGTEKAIAKKIKAGYVFIKIWTLGGEENASIMIKISLDKKENWTNGIFHNSRYYFFHIYRDGIVENFQCSYRVKKVRKKRVSSLKDAFNYINLKIEN